MPQTVRLLRGGNAVHKGAEAGTVGEAVWVRKNEAARFSLRKGRAVGKLAVYHSFLSRMPKRCFCLYFQMLNRIIV